MGSSQTLFTIGYEKRSLDEFLGILKSADVSALMDVRDTPWSHKPGFSKAALSKAAEEAGIAYVPARYAGNPKRLRASGASLATMLAAYANHLDETPEIERQFDAEVSDLHDRGARAVLVCFERDPAECHRGVLARRWAKRTGGTVRHLGTDDSLSLGLEPAPDP